MSLKNFSKVFNGHISKGTDFIRRLNGKGVKLDAEVEEMPLRDELFCAEQMEQHGKYLALKHTLGESEHLDRLLSRLDDNERRLIETHSLLTAAVKNKLRIVPAGEWLLDNFYLIDEQVRIARRHLPKDYSRELPRLVEGPSAGLPRVYDLALEVISHGDGRVDREALTLFVAAYQTVTPLMLGELWAIPIMLRLAMIENLRRVSVRIAAARVNVNLAQEWANRMLEIAESDPKSLILVIADMARSAPPMVSSFVAELERCLQGHGSALALPLTWIRQRLAESSLTIEQLVLSETQQQAADQASVSNTIGSLRFLGAMEWREFIEDMSLVERVLCRDMCEDNCGTVYSAMDFASRDRYRQVIDILAKRSPGFDSSLGQAEIHVAEVAIDLAKSGAVQNGHHDHTAHVGYYLIDQGRPTLETVLGVKLTRVERISRWLRRAPLVVYLGSITLLTMIFSGALLIPAYRESMVAWQFILLSTLVILAFSQLASALVNWLVTLLVRPQLLPRMDYSKGLPPEKRTLVVIPTLLSSARGVSDLLEALEVRFLGCRDPYLHFALLSDFCDADVETLPTDEPLLVLASRGIEKLNEKYQTGDHFFLLHRPRRWNPKENKWMGYERKRGKLAELNHALRGGGWDRFNVTIGNRAELSDVKYVITLDTDTELPRDSAQQFIATMAHPLNQPRYDDCCRRVVGGYGILQPRMAASLSGANRSRYAQLCGNEPGIDPYTRSVSDIYQDLFAEGSFIGKGIYDIDAFECALDQRFPENRILSHDLLEGCYARSGLLSDVHLYEEYPARYQTDVARQQRWIRGDWQIADWLLPRVPGFDGRRERNPLSWLSQWKVLDNLRRSLIPVVFMLLLLCGWFLFSQPWFWTLVVVGVLLIPSLLACVVDGLRRPQEVLYSRHLATVFRSVRQNTTLILFRFACLPFEACINFFTILRTSWRVLGTHKRLLEWSVFNNHSSSRGDSSNEEGLVAEYRSMWIAPALAVGVTVASGFAGLYMFIAVIPVTSLWLLAPLFSWWLSKPLVRNEHELSDEQLLFLRRIARKTWAFFDCFVTANDHWLPPDNFQEDPGPVLAHRTSPTNIGMSLLANISAADFGYISTGTLLSRCADTFVTLEKLERYQGHFYNWYDTETLQPLPPRYISSVDSGNLAGHLLTLRAALLELPTQMLVSPRVFDGLADSVSLMQEAVADVRSAIDESPFDAASMAKLQLLINEAVALQPMTLPGTFCCLQEIARSLACLIMTAAKHGVINPATVTPADEADEADEADRVEVLNVNESLRVNGNLSVNKNLSMDERMATAMQWLYAVKRQTQDGLDDLLAMAPWLTIKNLPEPMQVMMKFNSIPTLAELNERSSQWLAEIDHLVTITQQRDSDLSIEKSTTERDALLFLRQRLEQGQSQMLDRMASAQSLARQADGFAIMEYELLYDRSSHLLAVGYNVDECRCDTSYYDLLASEARLCNFVAIAQGQLPQESWFALGRLLTKAGGEPVLVSWSGSMFEYLMPLLVMPMYDSSLLEQSCRAAVMRQIAYGKQRSMPWGVSESGYNIVDANMNYQYHAFGVPGLGLKRGLAEEFVVAPYATALALMIAPEQACLNLQQFSSDGIEGRFGFYEAVDYTPIRLLRGQSHSVVRSFMAHHQGMTLLSLAYLLLQRPMQRRFVSDPALQATLLLLQERIPKTTVLDTRIAEHAEGEDFADAMEASLDAPMGAQTQTPEVQLLSNGRYQVMVTNAGGGYSRWQGFALTRWREDSTCDNWGSFIYLRDLNSGEYWSAAHQPTCQPAASYAAMFSEGRAEYRRRDGEIETYTEIVVSPEDDIELRRVRLTNRSLTRKTIEITSCTEVVLSTPDADAMQSAFGKLFVQTEVLSHENAILCSRRPRSTGEKPPWMFHLLGANGTAVNDISFETDRMRFIGRGRTSAAPQAMIDTTPLSGSQGSVLDPLAAIRCSIVLEPRQSATVDFIFGAASSREECMTLIERYQDRHLTDRVVDLAGTHSGVILRQINAHQLEAQLYRRLAGAVIYANATLRADASILIQNRRGQSGLWGYAISGDLPIVLLKITDINCLDHARQLIQCHAYWRLKGLAVDLVIWNENHIGYRQQLQDQIMGLIATSSDAHTIDRPGGIFVRFAEQISLEDRVLLQAAARVIIVDSVGTMMEQVNRRTLINTSVARLTPTVLEGEFGSPVSRQPHQQTAQHAPQLMLENSLGGFSADGTEYIITTSTGTQTPTPWVNVIANPGFGTVVTESGLAYSWSENAHEFRLTPWSDDPVGTSGGEALYLRDETSGQVWSPTGQPCASVGAYQTRHGFGYSVFEHSTAEGIHSELSIYVDLEEPVKYSVLRVRNNSGRTRELSATGFVEWVLGDLRAKTAMHVVTHIDAFSGALLAHNNYNTEFSGRVAFFDVDDMSRTLTGDRSEFLGRNGSLANPDALSRTHLSGRVGAALDPCGALQVSFALAAGEEREIIFRLGAGRDTTHASELAKRLRIPGTANAALARVKQHWQHTLGAVQIDTPDVALNVLANGWLVYQTLASRLWARSGFYQSGGAFGFRDQLQDAMALVHTQPALLRAQIVLCGQRQYAQGDVQHWWHPPSGRGVRTRCSDDFLWLPLATCRYLKTTGDVGVLNEPLNYLEGRSLNPDEESYYDLPGSSPQFASLYEHCRQAIEHGLRLGERGLPLMGSGDWNDGMNLVGIHGKGESVWLGFFLYQVLTAFADVALMHNDMAFSERCRKEAKTLRGNLAEHAWDGEWYKRAWFDDGTPLGSATNRECKIDSISQSWSVLSGAGDGERSHKAMNALDKYLVRREQGLVQLLDPPFDKSKLEPGYIKGYVPGVRENGGQYTHAAIWAAMAFAQLGDSVRAWELLTLINPINHTLTATAVATYKTEPYVVAADVYGVAPHIGRGGWTWYTGSAGWLYRLIIESLMGLSREADRLFVKPCLPLGWEDCAIAYRYGESMYHINIHQSTVMGIPSANTIALDGVEVNVGVEGLNVPLIDDQNEHTVDVTIYRVSTSTQVTLMKQ
ncbi:glycoside hydrolase family 94 protein [Pseudomaricurvus hydrocarbonicus]|nr:glycoside hydrolase family 94 protein [Aestuariicella hydrocarbonica]